MPGRDELIWTSNATEGLNLLSYSFLNASLPGAAPEAARFALSAGDEIVVTEMEHHANLIPWQQLAERTGATLRFIPVDDAGALDLEAAARIIGSRTRILAFTHASNVLGTINPVAALVALARSGRSARGAGRMPVRPAPAPGRQGPRRRLRRLLGPQDARPDRNRRAVRQGGTAQRDAAVPHRRLHDHHRHHGAGRVPAQPAAFRGRNPADLPGRRAGRGRELPDAKPGWTGSTPGSPSSGSASWRAWNPFPGSACWARQPARSGSAWQRSTSPASTRTTSGSSWTAGGSPCASGTTAPSRCTAGSGLTASTRASTYLYNTTDDVDAFLNAVADVRGYFQA